MSAQISAAPRVAAKPDAQPASAAAWPFLRESTAASRVAMLQFSELSVLIGLESEQLIEKQISFGRSVFDAWLHSLRALNDNALQQWASATKQLATLTHR